MSRPKIQRLLEERDLEEMPAPGEEVVEFWRKAVRALKDSRVAGLSPEGAFSLAYQVGLSAGTAILRAAGYRVKSRTRHHFVTFYVVEALTEGSELAGLAAELDGFRTDRHATNYGTGTSEATVRRQLAELDQLLSRFLPLAREWLIAARSDLADQLPVVS